MSVKTTEDMTLFLEDFGIDVYNQIVAHVDRKEQDIKVVLCSEIFVYMFKSDLLYCYVYAIKVI